MIRKDLLLVGVSGVGKSRSLKNLPNQERVVYFSCDAGKGLPFKNKFLNVPITDPMQLIEYITELQGNPDYDLCIIDTLTYLMEMYELQYVLSSDDTRGAWGTYATFFKTLMNCIAKSDKQFISIAHTHTETDKLGNSSTFIPVKGSLQKQGLESYFTTIIGVTKLSLNELTQYEANNTLLNITEREKLLGYKHVFQTRTTPKTIGDRLKGIEDLFNDNETYIDNDCGILLDRINKYYND